MLGFAQTTVRFMKSFHIYAAGFLTCAVMAFFIVPALAQEVATAIAEDNGGGGGAFGGQVMVFLLGLLVSTSAVIYKVVAKLINRGGDALDRLVENKIENEFLQSAILRVMGFVRVGAVSTWATTYKAIKADLQEKLKDGKITKDEFKDLRKNAGAVAKSEALRNIKAMTPRRILAIILGKDAPEDVINGYLGAVLETAIVDEKIIAKAASNGSGVVKN